MAAIRTVEVPTEDGRKVLIGFERGHYPKAWTVHISDELIQMAPETIHAALGQAVMQMREEGGE